jgi:hypothetical protein
LVTVPEQQTDERLVSAMLSIQFHSLGREGQIGRPPSLLLPPDLQPLPLDEALDVVRDRPDAPLWREVTWTLLRGTPHPPFGLPERQTQFAVRYPQPVRFFCATQEIEFPLQEFDRMRGTYRSDARLFASALLAFALDQPKAFEVLRCAIEERAGTGKSLFASPSLKQVLGGQGAEGFLDFINGTGGELRGGLTQRERCIQSLYNLEDDVGVSLETYIGEFADTIAFMELWPRAVGDAAAGMPTVYPAFTVARQDPQTLTTMVTATALVTGTNVEPLTVGMDPRSWAGMSTWFRNVEYVDASLRPKSPGPIGESHEPALLHEVVDIHAREGRTSMGSFENLLWVTFDVDKDTQSNKGFATLQFSLARSIRSRLLWDDRPGGLLVNGGWTKLRCLGPGLWRITSRKVLRFADRTPRTGREGPFDFGQSLNFLAPSTLSTWLESDIYGSTGRHE